MAKKATSTTGSAKGKAPLPRPGPAKEPTSQAPKKGAARAQAAAPAKLRPVTVTLRHLAAGIAEQHGLPKKQADTVVADVFGQLVNHLKAGERVRIGGLGIMEVKDRPARMGRNPATGEAIQVKASRKVAFRATKELKNAI